MFEKVLHFLVLSCAFLLTSNAEILTAHFTSLGLQTEDVNSMFEGSPFAALALVATYAGLVFISLCALCRSHIREVG